ncbi:MAG: glycosyltransferase family 4 protein [Candidatus Kapaibacterium sp.]
MRSSLQTLQTIACVCSSASKGGLELNMVRFAARMRRRGHRVVMLCVDHTPLSRMSTEEGLDVASIPRPWKYGDVLTARRVLRVIRSRSCTAVVVSLNHDLSMAARIKRMAPDLCMVYQQQMGLGVDKRDPLHTRRYRGLDAWVAPLVSLRSEVLQRTRVPADRVQMIPLAVDPAELGSPVSRAEARSQLGLPPESFIVGMIGRFDPAKGQLEAIRSMPQLLRAHPHLRLLLVGEASVGHEAHTELLHRVIDECGVRHAVHIHPFLPKPRVVFDAIDLFLMGTRSETFGMVTVEALMCGCPVAGTNSGGTPEILRKGEWGRLFEPGSVDEIVRVVRDAVDGSAADKERARSLVTAATDRFGAEHACIAYEGLLAHCMKHRTEH